MLQDKKFRPAGTLKLLALEQSLGKVGGNDAAKETEDLTLPEFKMSGIISVTCLSASLTRDVDMLSKQDPYIKCA